MKWFLMALWLVVALASCDELQEFIDGDDELMMLAWNDVTSYFEPNVLMQAVNPDDMVRYDSMTEEEIDADLWRLYGQLESVYQTLANFGKVITSLTPDNLLEIAEKLTNDQEFYDRMIGEPNHKLMSKLLHFRAMDHDEDLDGVHDLELLRYRKDLSSIPLEDLTEYKEEDEEDSTLNCQDPEKDYCMFAKSLLNDLEDIDSIEKMSIITTSKRIVKTIKKTIKRIKMETMVIVKMIKQKKNIKKTRLISCLKIMVLIEKIKHMVKLIVRLIRKLVIRTIKELPSETLWKIKVAIRLIVGILTDIIWELEILILEILVKISNSLKKMQRVPMEIVLYFKLALLEKLGLDRGGDDNKSENWKTLVYWLKVWPDTNEIGETETESERQALEDEGPDIEYVESDEIIVPDEFYEIFGSVLTKEEIDEVMKGDGAFNFDVVFPKLSKRGLINVFMSEPVEEYEAQELIKRRNQNTLLNIETNGTITRVMNSVTSFAHTLKLDRTTLLSAGITIVLYTTLVLI
jgi:hypothetical protein